MVSDSLLLILLLLLLQSVENCVCIMRNLSYHVHKEVPGAEKFQDPSGLQAPGSAGPQRKKKDDAGCFGGKKAKGERDDGHSVTEQ